MKTYKQKNLEIKVVMKTPLFFLQYTTTNHSYHSTKIILNKQIAFFTFSK